MDLTPAFLEGIQDCPEFYEAIDIVGGNSSGKIWLIGGLVYRTIARQLYGTPRPEADLDFIVEKTVTTFMLPDGWDIRINHFGNPKFVNGKRQIDYVPLDNIKSIQDRGLQPSIENYFSGTPLTVQSIAYDVQEDRVIGEVGINAILKREIAIHHLLFARYAAQKKGKSLEAYIKEKAQQVGFRAVLPN